MKTNFRNTVTTFSSFSIFFFKLWVGVNNTAETIYPGLETFDIYNTFVVVLCLKEEGSDKTRKEEKRKEGLLILTPNFMKMVIRLYTP